MNATARDRAFDEMSREHPRVLPGVGCFQMLYTKYLSIVTTSQVPCYPLTTNTVLSGAEEALPRRVQPAEAGCSSACEASHFVSDAMQIRMVQLRYAGRRTRLPGRTSQHGEIAQDGVPYYCPQGLQ